MFIYQELKWDNHIDSKKAQQRQYFLRQLRKLSMSQELLKQFCHHRVCPVFIYHCLVWFSNQRQTSEDYNGQSGLLRGLSVPLCPTSKNFTPPERGKEIRKSPWTLHTQLTISLNCCPLVGTTEHWAPKQPDTRTVLTPRPYPTWTTYNTPHCTSFNNSSNLHLYIGHMHIHSSVYGHFLFCIFIFYYYCYS